MNKRNFMSKSMSICLLAILLFQVMTPITGYLPENGGAKDVSEEHTGVQRSHSLAPNRPQEREDQRKRNFQPEKTPIEETRHTKQAKSSSSVLTSSQQQSFKKESMEESSLNLMAEDTNLNVTINAPANNSTVSSTVDIEVYVNDTLDGNISRATLFRNGTNMTEWNTTGSHTYPWDTTRVKDATYNITLQARDGEGNVSSVMIYTIVSNHFWVDVEGTNKGIFESAPSRNLSYILNHYNLTDTNIHLGEGIYNQSVGESFPLNFTEYENVTINTTEPASKVIFNAGKNQGFRVTANNFTFSNLTIRNATDAIYLGGSASDIRVVECTLTRSVTGIRIEGNNTFLSRSNFTKNQEGIQVTGHNNTILENNINDNKKEGLHLRSATSAKIFNNIMEGNEVGFLVEGGKREEYDHEIKGNQVNGREAYYLFNETDRIFSGNETTHFTFAFCENITLKNSNITGGDFLRLVYTNNSALSGNDIKSNFRGVRIENSKNITVRGGSLSHNTHGISLISSNNITIGSNNTLVENTYGIYSEDIYNATISENNFTMNNYSVYLTQDSEKNTVTGNNISSVKYGIYLSSSHNNMITRNMLLSKKYGIYLKASHENSLEKNHISDTTHSIYVKQATKNEFKENTLINCRYGVYFSSATENEVTKNNLTSIAEYGIYLKNSHENHFEKNNILNTTHSIYVKQATKNEFKENTLHVKKGFHLEMAHKNEIRNNYINVTAQYAIYFSSSKNNTVKGNVIVANNTAGMYLSYSNWNRLEENQIRSGRYGMMLYYSSGNEILRNNLTFASKGDLIFLYYSNNVEITGNNLRRSEENGIYLDHSNSFKISNNEIMNNTKHGIYLYYSNNGEITRNEVENNGKSGIYLTFLRSLDIRENNLQSNGKDGIYLYHASDNMIVRNTIIGNRYGVYLNHADNNMILRNQFKKNSKEAIHKEDATGNNITGNEIPQKDGIWKNYQSILITLILAVIGVGGLLLLVRSKKEE